MSETIETLYKIARIPRREMTLEQYSALPTREVGDAGRKGGWTFYCDCGRYHLADDPLGEGDILYCRRSKRMYRCL